MYVVLLSKSIEDIKNMIGRTKNTTYKYFVISDVQDTLKKYLEDKR